MALTLSQPLIRQLESLWFKSGNETEGALQPVFIIGAPRTGSTILYQAITNAYQFSYIDNTACFWHRNLRFGLWLSRKKYGLTAHNNFKAEHGNTSSFGGHAPSECGQFWYRWLPRDRHFIDFSDITDRMVREIREEVLGASDYLRRPLLFKNLNVGQRLRLIRRAFPNAKIIFVRRDPRFVVRSILKAREKVGIPPNEWWSIMPPNVEELKSLPETKMCAAQVYYLEKQIEEDLGLFPTENVREIHYRELSSQLIEELAEWIGVAPRAGGKLPDFRKDSVEEFSTDEQARLDRIAADYSFRKDIFN